MRAIFTASASKDNMFQDFKPLPFEKGQGPFREHGFWLVLWSCLFMALFFDVCFWLPGRKGSKRRSVEDLGWAFRKVEVRQIQQGLMGPQNGCEEMVQW